MICEKCGGPMQWRCTDKDTRVAKYKCPECGHLQTGIVDFIGFEKKEKFVPKHYTRRTGPKTRYEVKRIVKGKRIYVGLFDDEDTAKKVVEKMNQNDWDDTKIQFIFDELGLDKVHRGALV